MKELATYTNITFCKVVGGTRVNDCISDLKKDPQVIVGTPGRIIDMLSKQFLFTDKLKTIVIDEADEMLSQGFQEMIHNIFQFIPRETQVGLFSATFPDELMEITDKFMDLS